MLIQEYLKNSAEIFPDKAAIIQAGRETTYGEILQQARSVSQWLINRNLQPGDRVAILIDDPSEYVIAYFSILLAGGIVVALNTQTSSRTLKYILNDCRISIALTHIKFTKYIRECADELPDLRLLVLLGYKKDLLLDLPFTCADLKEAQEFSPQNDMSDQAFSDLDISQIIYTSGTTSKPKGVMLRHSNLAANTRSIIKYLKLDPDERHMVVLPFFYSFGNSVLLTHFAVGATLVVHQSFLYPKIVLDMMVNQKVTGLSGVPSTYAILFNRSPIRDYTFPQLRYLAQAGGAMSPKLAMELKSLLPNVDIYIMYGQTEACARLSYLHPCDLLRKSGSIGKAIPEVTLQVLDKQGVPVKIGETGEIVARGKNIMAGYLNDPIKTKQILKEEGLWTGDLARIDEEGFLYIISRKNEMIKSGAHRIGPKEIEEVILEHDAVHEVAVLGIEDTILGETIKAAIVLNTNAVCTKKNILVHCRKNLPAYKVPRQITFYDQLPKTASGKVKKNELKV